MFEIVQENLSLLKLCLVLLFLVPFPTLAFFFGGSLLSLGLSITEGLSEDERSEPMAIEMVQGALLKKSLGFLLLVLVGIGIFLVHLIYRPPLYTLEFWAACLGILAGGIVFMYAYSYLLRTRQGLTFPLAIGSGGIAFLTLALFLLFCGSALLFTPEKWPFLADQPRLFFSWAGVAFFLQFLSLSLATTGTALVVAYKYTPDPAGPSEVQVKKIGRSALIFLVIGLLSWPPLVLFEIIHLPDIAFSPWVFGLFILGTFLALITCWLGFSYCVKPAPKPPMILAITLMGVFLCSALAHHLIRENILNPAVTTFPSLPNVAKSVSEAGPAVVVPDQTTTPADGEKLFNRSCSVCHAFDRRVVGPPLNSVLSKYKGQADKLSSFIANPVKINPDYPSMPRLGLPEEEIKAITDWLLEDK
jgi:cytochrome c551/c552